MIEFHEVEFKYYADSISRASFDEAITKLDVKKELTLISNPKNGKDSIDHYFSSGARFMRFREGQDSSGRKTWELTSKIKLNAKNNQVRTEVNISLNANGMTFEKAKEFSTMHELQYDFSIKKDVQIYWLADGIVLSHYTTFNMDGKELNTFMEIEADETVPWPSSDLALQKVVEYEKKLEFLGINPQKRVKKSLFEFYTKDTLEQCW